MPLLCAQKGARKGTLILVGEYILPKTAFQVPVEHSRKCIKKPVYNLRHPIYTRCRLCLSLEFLPLLYAAISRPKRSCISAPIPDQTLSRSNTTIEDRDIIWIST